MDLLTDISKQHEQHLHKLDTMVYKFGEELQVIKVRQEILSQHPLHSCPIQLGLTKNLGCSGNI